MASVLNPNRLAFPFAIMNVILCLSKTNKNDILSLARDPNRLLGPFVPNDTWATCWLRICSRLTLRRERVLQDILYIVREYILQLAIPISSYIPICIDLRDQDKTLLAFKLDMLTALSKTCHVNRLPVELLRRIFWYCGGEVNIALSMSDTTSPANLRRTCHIWNDIAVTTHRLWRTIVLDIQRERTSLPHHSQICSNLALCARYSGNAPLSLDLKFDCDPATYVVGQIFVTIGTLLPRCEIFRIQAPSIYVALLSRNPPCLLPLLHSLYLDFSIVLGSFRGLQTFCDAPLLRRVHLESITPGELVFDLPWQQLQQLCISLGQLAHLELIQTLCPKLEVLLASHSRPADRSHILLKTLDRLITKAAFNVPCILPHSIWLRHLTIHSWSTEWEHVFHFDLFLNSLPCLNFLSLKVSHYDLEFIGRAFLPQETGSIPAPLLHHLTLFVDKIDWHKVLLIGQHCALSRAIESRASHVDGGLRTISFGYVKGTPLIPADSATRSWASRGAVGLLVASGRLEVVGAGFAPWSGKIHTDWIEDLSTDFSDHT